MRQTPQLQKASTIAISGLLLLLATAEPARSVAGDAEAEIGFRTLGPVESLIYELNSYHNVEFTQFNALEALAPVTLSGQITRGFATCLNFGQVNNLIIECTNLGQNGCPHVEGTYRAETRAVAYVLPLGQFFTKVSGPLIANCLPGGPDVPPCEEETPPGFPEVIDLDSGRRLDTTVSRMLTPTPLGRVEARDGKAFIMDEWVVLSGLHGAGPEGTEHQASSQVFLERSELLARELNEALVQQKLNTSGRFLVIQAPRHLLHLVPPLIKFDSEGLDFQLPRKRDQRVVMRATFSESGVFQEVETIEGESWLARVLAHRIQLDFLDGNEHRTIVYATFDLAKGLEPLAAVSVFPQCCCGNEPSEPPCDIY